MNEIKENIQVSKETENMVDSLIEKFIDLIQND